MSTFSSFYSLSIKQIPKSLFTPLKIQSLSPNPSKIQSLSPKSSIFLLYRAITIERLSVKKPLASSSSSNGPLQSLEELPIKLQEIVKLFQQVEEPKAKYEQLLFYGRNLRPLSSEFKTRDNKVQGCVSQVWVRAYLDDKKNVIFEADSDSMLTKGLAALLVKGLSGEEVKEIARVTPDFVTLLGLQQSLTPSRNNGFLNMLKLMQKKAMQLYVEAENVESSGLEVKNDIVNVNVNVNGSSGVSFDEKSRGSNFASGNDGSLGSGAMRSNKTESKIEDLRLEVENGNVDVNGSSGVSFGKNSSGSGSGSSNDGSLGSRGARIKERLELKLRPVELMVEDISYQHAGHAGVRGSDGETHFNVKVVSDEFEGKSLVKRHRLIYGLLQDELQNGLHALSIVAKTPSEVGGD